MDEYPELPGYELKDAFIRDLKPGDLFIFPGNKKYVFCHDNLQSHGAQNASPISVCNSPIFRSNTSSISTGGYPHDQVKLLVKEGQEEERSEPVQKYILKSFSSDMLPKLDDLVAEYITDQAALGYDFLSITPHHDQNLWVISVLLVSYEVPI